MKGEMRIGNKMFQMFYYMAVYISNDATISLFFLFFSFAIFRLLSKDL